ncbi:MAG: hypothetical protein ACR2J8_01295, partial [Thermomicrobiales bacterium]
SGCFASAATTWPADDVVAMATDGVNVYFASQNDGGLSCPIADLGANCTRIMAGPWGSDKNRTVWSLAAANGQIWIGQYTGEIYRCPANLPYADQDNAPSQCVLLDDAGKRGVQSLLLANGTLYAGLNNYGTNDPDKPGMIWSCSPDTVNDCATLDTDGITKAYSLAAGGGYLWAGLGNGIVWRCDLNAANACANWDTAGNSVRSLSYDGQGTLYAAVPNFSNDFTVGVIWSCLTAEKNRCYNVMPTHPNGWSVAAGAGSVFSSVKASYPTTKDVLYYGTSPFTAASSSTWDSTLLLYLPADGPVGVGGVSLTVKAKALSQKLEKRCSKPGRTARATVTVTGPEGFTKTMKAGACALVKNGAMKHRVDLLDPGDYTVSVQAGKHSGEATFTIVQDQTRPVNVKLTRGSAGG